MTHTQPMKKHVLLLLTLLLALSLLVPAAAASAAVTANIKVGTTQNGTVNNTTDTYYFTVANKQQVTLTYSASIQDPNMGLLSNWFGFTMKKASDSGTYIGVDEGYFSHSFYTANARTVSNTLVKTLEPGKYSVEMRGTYYASGSSPLAYTLTLTDTSNYAKTVSAPKTVSVVQYKPGKAINLRPPANTILGPVKWTTSNKAIARVTVTDGKNLLYGYKTGTATLTAKLSTGRSYRIKVKVTANTYKTKAKASLGTYPRNLVSVAVTKAAYDAKGKLRVEVVFANRTSRSATALKVTLKGTDEFKNYASQTYTNKFNIGRGKLVKKTYTVSKTPAKRLDLSGGDFRLNVSGTYRQLSR